jgi:hypothetical protein
VSAARIELGRRMKIEWLLWGMACPPSPAAKVRTWVGGRLLVGIDHKGQNEVKAASSVSTRSSKKTRSSLPKSLLDRIDQHIDTMAGRSGAAITGTGFLGQIFFPHQSSEAHPEVDLAGPQILYNAVVRRCLHFDIEGWAGAAEDILLIWIVIVFDDLYGRFKLAVLDRSCQ